MLSELKFGANMYVQLICETEASETYERLEVKTCGMWHMTK